LISSGACSGSAGGTEGRDRCATMTPRAVTILSLLLLVCAARHSLAAEELDLELPSDDLAPVAYDAVYDTADDEQGDNKRAPSYGFGLGKREPYGFGLGKRAPSYGFGLGKRASSYGFGLGKRASSYSYGPVRRAPSYGFGLGKRAPSYAFGLGKRAPSYGFGLGKRAPSYGFGLGKRAPSYSFGLGKRQTYGFGLGKRTSWGTWFDGPTRDVLKRPSYGFGLGKRSAPEDQFRSVEDTAESVLRAAELLRGDMDEPDEQRDVDEQRDADEPVDERGRLAQGREEAAAATAGSTHRSRASKGGAAQRTGRFTGHL